MSQSINSTQKKLRICCPVLGIEPDTNSGGGMHDREVLKALAEEGAVVEILQPKGRPHFTNLNNWHVEYTPIKHIFPPYLFNIFVLPYLIRKYRKGEFNCIRLFNPYFAGPAVAIFKHFHKEVPVVARYHHLEEHPFMRLIDKLLINTWDKIVVSSNFTKNDILDNLKVSPEKIEVHYSGTDTSYYPTGKDKDLLRRFGMENKIILLYLGGLKSRKNLSFLLDLMAEIKDDNVNLLICGSGNDKKNLEKRSETLNLTGKVKFAGFIEEGEKIKYYNLADIMLFPTTKEGFGHLPLEAGLCAKPTIASDISAVPEVLVDGKMGFLAKYNDKKDWLEKINLLVKNEKLRIEMGQNSRIYCLKLVEEKFNWTIVARKLIKVFDDLI